VAKVLVNSLLVGRAKWKEKCGLAKVELQAFRGQVRDLEVSREKWRVQAEESESLRQDLAQQLESAKAQNKQLEVRPAESVDEIRRNGYSRSSAFQVALRVQRHGQTIAGRELTNHLVSFIADESAALAPGERLPGSSEPLEWSLGKLKSFEGDFGKSGFTGLLPAFGALVGRMTPETIYTALVSVTGKNVPHWITQHLGQSFLSKRRLALQNFRNTSHVNNNKRLSPIFSTPEKTYCIVKP